MAILHTIFTHGRGDPRGDPSGFPVRVMGHFFGPDRGDI